MSGAPRPPDRISLEEHRDHPHPLERLARWLVVAAVAAVVLAGLAGAFGQRPDVATATRGGTTLRVSAPEALRSGLFFQGRFEIRSARAIRRPALVLSAGWLDAITVNTVQPEPERTASEHDGALRLEFAPLEPGRAMTVYVALQVNPTTLGRREHDVALLDGDRALVALDRSVTIFP